MEFVEHEEAHGGQEARFDNGLDTAASIMIDRMRRMAGREEKPWAKWKKLAARHRLDGGKKLNEMKEQLMHDQIAELT